MTDAEEAVLVAAHLYGERYAELQKALKKDTKNIREANAAYVSSLNDLKIRAVDLVKRG